MKQQKLNDLIVKEDIFKNILHGITDPVLLLSKDFRILWANKAFQEQTNYTIDEIIGNHCYRITHKSETPCQPPHDICPVSEAEKTAGTITATHTHFDKDGSKIFVEVRAYPVKDEKGETIQFVYMYRDITKIKKAEEELQNALREAKRRETERSALLEGAYAILKYHEFTEAAKSIFNSCKNSIGATSGYVALLSKDGSKNEVLFLDSGGLPCTVDPSLPMPIRGLRAEAYLKNGPVYDNDFSKSEWINFMPKGHMRLKNVLFAPMILDGKTVGLFGLANKPGGFNNNDALIASAFSELAAIALIQKRSEELLGNSLQVWYKTFDAVDDPICLIDMKGEILRCNQAMTRYIGKSFEEIIGRHFKELLYNLSEQTEKCIMRMHKTRDKVTAIVNEGKIWFEMTLYPVLDGANNLVSAVFIISDITARKNVEDALLKSEQELSIRDQINHIFLTFSEEDMYAEILEVVLNIMKSEYGTFGYFDEQGSFIAPAVTRRIFWEKCNIPDKEIIFQKGTFSGIWGRAIKEQKTLIDNEGPFHMPEGHVPIKNTMVTPVIFHDELISAIHIANKPGGYDEKDKAIVEMIADKIAPILYARLQRDKHEKNRKLAEEALRKANDELEYRVEKRTAEILSINEQLLQEIKERKQAEEDLRNSREQLHNLYANLQSAREEERTRIAREIHDEFGEILTALKIDISGLAKNRQDHKSLSKKTKLALDLVDSAIKTVQRISSELRPGILDHIGLAEAIEWQVKEFSKRTGINCTHSIDIGEIKPSRELSTTVFRILQETLTNSARHSNATKINIDLKEKEGSLVLKVIDNGKGIKEKQLSDPKSFGIMGIRERVEHHGGEVDIKGIRNKGTAVTLRVPLKNKE